ncbi:hypothetical protein AVEN_97936-1 [Araneus ventricosus]|uniref:Uncharacterized protein n=1 Tax=Araneus ventricosus TaxID=182803 RepID=A0A4Y2JYN5_ARAVE|nr:hypothetical protein AVEN_97936-1 [Araneus ventricosus]
MSFGQVNPIESLKSSLCTTTLLQESPFSLFSNGQMARGSGQLHRSKHRCEVNVPLRQNGMHFLPRISIKLTGNPWIPNSRVYSGVDVNVYRCRINPPPDSGASL